MATKSAPVIDIKPMQLEKVNFTIVGDTPLIVHNWSTKAKQMMLDKQTGKAKKAKHEIKVPVNDFIESMYWLTDKPELGATDEEAEQNFMTAIEAGARFGFPISGIKQSIIMGAGRGGLDVKMTELRGSMFLEGATDLATFDLAEVVSDTPVIREDMVRVGGMSKTADIRYRAEFHNWSIPLTLTYNANGKYSLEQLMNCINHGGYVTGIGEWRPEKDGQYGMYHLQTS